MQKILLFLVVAVTLVGAAVVAQAADRRADPSRLVIMTFNAEFLWDGIEPEEGRVNFPWKGSAAEAREHMAGIAELIIASDPDVINLVEVEGLAALKRFADAFLAGRGYRAYLAKGTDTFTGQDVGLLTRIDPEGMAIERDTRKGRSGDVVKSVSKNYVARLAVGDLKIGLVGIHYLARPSSQNRRAKRQAQADATLGVAMQLAADGYLPVVLGDFNDFDGADGVRDHVDNRPITNVMAAIKGMGTAAPADDLVNLLSLVPKEIRYTAFWDRNRNDRVDPPDEFSAIDHILVAPALANLVSLVEIPQAHDPRVVSDHFPVVAHLRLPAGPTTVGGLRIASLLPNPPGDDRQHEQVTLLNRAQAAVSLDGWQLRDRAATAWRLDGLGSVAPAASVTIRRDGKPMALNNRGDRIDLVDPTGQIVHTVTYGRVAEGELVEAQ